MFTGIVETVGQIIDRHQKGKNITFTVETDLAEELQVDQSLAHNGVCLTVESTAGNQYTVTAIDETLSKSNLRSLQPESPVNLERSLTLESRIDGHLMQGHVDTVARVTTIKSIKGSWLFTFTYDKGFDPLLIEKGSVAVNGVSLTAFNCRPGMFSVAVIPYTFKNTVFCSLEEGAPVNLEFDVIGKYVGKWVESYNR